MLLQAQQLTLPDAINIALRNSLSIQIARNNVDIAHIYDNYGVAGGLPYLNANGSDLEQLTDIKQKYSDPTKNTTRNNALSNNLSESVAGTILLFNGSRVVSAKHRLDVTNEQAKQYLVSRTMLVAANVMMKYYDIVRQQSYATTLKKTVEVSQKKLDIIKVQQSVGMANNADLFQAQVDLNTQQLALQSQQLLVDQDITDLLTQLTLNPDSSLVIKDTIVVDKDVHFDTILNNLENNPDIIAATQQVQINRYLVKETAAQRYPSLYFDGGYNINRTENEAGFTLLNQQIGPYAGVGLNIPIFNGTVYARQQKVAGINVKNAQLARDTLSLGYTSGIVKNWQAYRNNLQQLETAVSNLDVAQKLLDLVLQRFQLRQNTILDVENAQQSYQTAAYTVTNLEYAAKVAEIQLKRYANRLNL
jgi:outer membrane protein TolC